MSLAVLLLVAAMALTARQAAPPTIAEFAPQAAAQITESSAESGGTAGTAPGQTPPPQDALQREGAVGSAIDVARVRQCVGDPPRQIEDPQSPPCVPYWSGDNGGATSHGVTRDEIRIVTQYYNAGFHGQLEAFFNRRFEFYGRRIRILQESTVPNGTPEGDRAAARSDYERDHAFASTGTHAVYNYFDELARVGVVGAGISANPYLPESFMAPRRPYIWQYPMANDRMLTTAGDWFCSRFAGRNAGHAGDPVLQDTRRKLGIIINTAFAGTDGITSADPMNAQLKSCGEHAQVARVHGAIPPDAASTENAILQMKTSGVTSVLWLGWVVDLGVGMRTATNQAYFPEWLVTTYVSMDNNQYVQFGRYPPEQSENLMALSVLPKHRPGADHPSNWTSDSPRAWVPDDDDRYHPLLLIASGIQMAGPHLTPATFERGLHQTVFPNPPHRIMPGTVGFRDGDHSMIDDAAEMWWSNTAIDPNQDIAFFEGAGAFCYVDRGARRRVGSFPKNDPFFAGECDTGAA